MSRGKEYKGQTLVIDGSRSGASTVATQLAYDSAFNLEFIGEARYGSADTDPYWYIEKLSYDSAFNLTTIQTAQNRRILAPPPTFFAVVDDGFAIRLFATPSPDDINPFLDVKPGDQLFFARSTLQISVTIVENLGDKLTFDTFVNAGGAAQLSQNLILTLNDYTTKDFNKRLWAYRDLYEYE